MFKRRSRALAQVAAVLLAGLCIAGRGPSLEAEGPTTWSVVSWGRGPISEGDFSYSDARGFGDAHNTWAQAMEWWHGRLYVGTARESACGAMFAVWTGVSGLLGTSVANALLPYPPLNSDLSCPQDGNDLSSQAEIWSWSPDTDLWTRVFQSPLDLDNPGPGGGVPPPVGKKLPYEVSIRDFASVVEPDGTEALYAFGVNATLAYDRSKLPPPRILRTTDGVSWTPLPQTPGTFLGDLPFNPDHGSFRSPVMYKGRLYALSGPIFGQGSLIGSADPARGDNAWFLASPRELLFYDTAVFNGWLYLGTFDPANGYSILKTDATGGPPYRFITVVPPGAGLTTRPSKSVVSMHVYQDRLYVGTATYTELIRINADDTWDLVVGSPRQLTTTSGTEWKYPLSGLDNGFGHSLNDHIWQMEDANGELFLGTYNASTGSHTDPVNGPKLLHNMGAHLYRTDDGWRVTPITTNGFAKLGDVFGGLHDYGIRTMADTPFGLFLGTANDAHGLAILRADPRKRFSQPSAPAAARALEVEPTNSGAALLSWIGDPNAVRSQVWRAERSRILVRDELNFELWNGLNQNKIPDTYIGPYELVGTTAGDTFVDTTALQGISYMYYVVELHPDGRTSQPSNLVGFPLLTPSMTFAQLLSEVDRWAARGRFRDLSALNELRARVMEAQASAAACKLDWASRLLKMSPAESYLLAPESVDLKVIVSKLVRRLQLVIAVPRQTMSSEFCTM